MVELQYTLWPARLCNDVDDKTTQSGASRCMLVDVRKFHGRDYPHLDNPPHDQVCCRILQKWHEVSIAEDPELDENLEAERCLAFGGAAEPARVDPEIYSLEDGRVFASNRDMVSVSFPEGAIEGSLEVGGVEADDAFVDFEGLLRLAGAHCDLDNFVEVFAVTTSANQPCKRGGYPSSYGTYPAGCLSAVEGGTFEAMFAVRILHALKGVLDTRVEEKSK